MSYAKKSVYFTEAERLYVTESCSLEDIAARIPVSSRTLSDWKKEGDWERKAAEFLKQKEAFHVELYDFSRVLLKKVKEDIENGKDPSSGQLFTLTKLLGLFGKVKEYEEEKEAQKPKTASGDKKEELLNAISEILGV